MDGGWNSGYSSHMNNGVGKNKPKDFKKVAQTIGTNIEKISQNATSMTKMINLMGTPQDSQDLRQQLHQIQHYTKNLVKDTSTILKELHSIPIPHNTSEQRECKMQKERLEEGFAAALNLFQEIQRKVYKKQKEEAQKKQTPIGIPPPPASNPTDMFGDSRFSDQLIELQDSSNRNRQLQAQVQADEIDLQMIEQQEAAIEQLGRDIYDVNQIFKEIGTMVHEQGETIDSIEASVEKTHYGISEGVSHLRQANELSTKLRKKRCYLFLICAVILLILILLIYYGM
ncbi:syntaxin 7 [Lycorma delicatula]|uniref:syntaxin 7 n=1 Tax=Lycorma delicatula TaxID=130591 RepID=UPI003F510EFF